MEGEDAVGISIQPNFDEIGFTFLTAAISQFLAFKALQNFHQTPEAENLLCEYAVAIRHIWKSLFPEWAEAMDMKK